MAMAFKDYRINPFTNRGGGELMIIHQCLNCGKISPNRIAGDDNEYQIICIMKGSINLDESLIAQIRNMGLKPIASSNIEEAYISLLGINYQDYIKTWIN